jgi:hypothetical protein
MAELRRVARDHPDATAPAAQRFDEMAADETGRAPYECRGLAHPPLTGEG